jgi:putative transposase
VPRTQALPLALSERERAQLESLVRQATCPQQVALRARIVLAADAGEAVRESARRLGVARSTVQGWRRRWLVSEGSVAERLADAPRSGTPPTFTAEQICAIVALACEPPQDSGRPITHWTQPELADEAAKRGIVASISPDSIGRFLKGGRPQAAPHARLAERQA